MVNRPIVQTNPLDQRTTYSYDQGWESRHADRSARAGGEHRVRRPQSGVGRVDPLGARTTITYSPTGQVATVTDPSNRVTTTFQFDAARRAVAVIDPVGARTTTGYDPVGNPITRIDAPPRA